MLASAAAGFLLAVVLLQPWNRPAPLGIAPTSKAPPQPIAHLALATGVVEIHDPGSGQWRAMETGGAVRPGDRVRTGPDVRCEFRGADGSELRLNAGSELTFDSARQLQLASGQMWSTVARAREPLRVSLPLATATADAAQVDFRCASSNATVTVVDGTTRVRDAVGEKTISSGERLTISNGRSGEPGRAGDLLVATRWVNEILMLKGRDNPELARRIDDLFAQIGQQKMAFMYEEEIRSLGDHCVVPLTRYIESERSRGEDQKRRTAARILSDAAGPRSIPDLIELLGDRDGEIRASAARALERLTGRTQGRTAQQWRSEPGEAGETVRREWSKWWESTRDRPQPIPSAPERSFPSKS